MIIEAARLAAYGHTGQTRKWGHSDQPYILHPARVAGMVTIHKDSTEKMVAAAWLHDVLEDTSVTEEDIITRFGREVAVLVKDMTNVPKDSHIPRDIRKAMDRERLMKVSDEAKLIKLCDRIDNLREIWDDSQTPYDFKKMYMKESVLLLKEALSGVNHNLEVELMRLAE